MIDLEVYVDAYFVRNWDLKETEDQDTAILRQGYIITYAGCWHVTGLGEEFCIWPGTVFVSSPY